MNLNAIKEKSLNNELLSNEEAQFILSTSDDNIMSLVAAACEVRQKYFGKRVKLNYLVNVKSGLCPEDCQYCSQSKVSGADIEKYPLMPAEQIIKHVERGLHMGAKRACLVASGRGPGEKEMAGFCDAVETLKQKYPSVEVCACLGLLKAGQAERLKQSGVKAYNHNINTSKAHYEKICGTHGYDDRVDTIEKAKCAGLSSCSGVLVGMGEAQADIIDMAMTLRKSRAESIPVNFLVAIDKTPLERINNLTPQLCLKILALFRLVNPTSELRIAGGREVHLRHLQPVGLTIANSIFIGDYLTTTGQPPKMDLEMIRDLGYVVEGQPEGFLPSLLGELRLNAELKTPVLA